VLWLSRRTGDIAFHLSSHSATRENGRYRFSSLLALGDPRKREIPLFISPRTRRPEKDDARQIHQNVKTIKLPSVQCFRQLQRFKRSHPVSSNAVYSSPPVSNSVLAVAFSKGKSSPLEPLCSSITSKHRLCSSFTKTLKDSGVPGFGAFSPLTIDS
jgi:hypothetical protein